MVSRPSTLKLPPSSSPALGQAKPWYRYVNLDLLIRILVNSVFHPYIVFIFYLTQAALHLHREPLAYYTLCYAAFLGVVEIGVNINQRLTYGKHRKVEWEKEVVVITGGGSGLGRVLAEMIVRKGGKVAILDVKQPDEEAEDTMERWDLVWEKCDVSKESDVKEAVDRIVDDVSSVVLNWVTLRPQELTFASLVRCSNCAHQQCSNWNYWSTAALFSHECGGIVS